MNFSAFALPGSLAAFNFCCGGLSFKQNQKL